MLSKIYLSMRDVHRAREHIDRALQLDPYNAGRHYLLGLVLKEEKRHDQAIVAFQRVISLKPNLTDAYNMLGNVYADLGSYREAVPFYLKAIELEPKEPEPHLNLAGAYRDLGKNHESEKELAIYKKLTGGR